MQRLLKGALITGLLMMPIAASALTADELRVQINDLMAKIQALQTQIGTTGGTTVTGSTGSSGTVTTSTGVASCPRIGRVLKMGSSGDDVTRLQQFLANDPSVYPEANVSGYYGALTEAAVKRFQCKYKVVCDGDAASTGYGVTGPRTAAILSLQCSDSGASSGGGTTSQVSGFIKVMPTSGASPLPVSIEATINTAHVCGAATYQIDFGDGTTPASLSVPAGGCNEIQQVFAHTYAAGGTYQVLLRSGTHQVSATVSVTQGSGASTVSDSFTGSPTSGASPLTVSFSGLVNANTQCNSGPYSINFGDGQSANITVAGCTATNFSVPHTYSTSGTFTARLYRGTPAVNIGGGVSINAGGSVSTSGGSFSVSGGINGNALASRALFDLTSTCARYDLDWGDGTAHASQADGSCASGVASKEVTHTYPSAGTYTIILKRGSSLNFTDTAGITIVQ
jgi:peptidoglycan hydrolase-like protein with peptidoglycan-binding domain